MSRLLPTSLLTTLVLSVVAAPPASSQWSPSGVRLCQVGCAGQGPQIISDGWGGAYIVWLESRNYSITDDDVYLQRVTATGEIAPGWPQDGFPVCVFPRTQYPQGIAPDGLGGVLVVWYDHRNVDLGTAQDLYAQRILADGTLAPGWPVNGAPVSRAPRFQGDAVIAPDGTGGAFVAWVDERDLTGGDVYAQHLTAGGSVAPGWPADGLGICVLPQGVGGPRIMPDGAGGFVVVWGDARRGVVDVYAQHLLADGSLAPGWAANGVPVALDRGIRQAVLDGAGGFYVGCVIVNQEFSDGEYYAQRFSFAGSRPAGWPEGGVRVCGAPGNRESLELSPDGVGGALLAWYDYRPPPTGGEIYAARVRADGALAPGWPVDGLRVSDAGGPGFEFFESFQTIAPDGLGGAYIVWGREDYSGDPSFVQHLTVGGQVAPGWPPYGVRLSPTSHQLDAALTSDGRGGAIVAWERNGSELGIFAQRFVMDGVVAVQVALVSATAEPDRVVLMWHAGGALSFGATLERRGERSDWQPLAAVRADGTGRIVYEDRAVEPGERYAYRLAYTEDGSERWSEESWVEVPRTLVFSLEGLRPNPAAGDLIVAFTLPSASPATLELLDVSGRRLLSREVGALGAGHHRLRLDEGLSLAPGIYWLRLTQDGRSHLVRGVALR